MPGSGPLFLFTRHSAALDMPPPKMTAWHGGCCLGSGEACDCARLIRVHALPAGVACSAPAPRLLLPSACPTAPRCCLGCPACLSKHHRFRGAMPPCRHCGGDPGGGAPAGLWRAIRRAGAACCHPPCPASPCPALPCPPPHSIACGQRAGCLLQCLLPDPGPLHASAAGHRPARPGQATPLITHLPTSYWCQHTAPAWACLPGRSGLTWWPCTTG